jgi:hypothetical protein
MEATSVQVFRLFCHEIVGKACFADGSSIATVFRKIESLSVLTLRYVSRGKKFLYALLCCTIERNGNNIEVSK